MRDAKSVVAKARKGPGSITFAWGGAGIDTRTNSKLAVAKAGSQPTTFKK